MARKTDDMNLIRRFLSGYTENFLLAATLWPLASLTLTLPILARLYHRDGRLRFGSAVATYLAVHYVPGGGSWVDEPWAPLVLFYLFARRTPYDFI